MIDDETPNMTLSKANSGEGMLVLGLLCIKQLLSRGQCSFFINRKSEVELVNPIELALDALPEEQALQHLINQNNYTDDQLVVYLRGREERLALSVRTIPV